MEVFTDTLPMLCMGFKERQPMTRNRSNFWRNSELYIQLHVVNASHIVVNLFDDDLNSFGVVLNLVDGVVNSFNVVLNLFHDVANAFHVVLKFS